MSPWVKVRGFTATSLSETMYTTFVDTHGTTYMGTTGWPLGQSMCHIQKQHINLECCHLFFGSLLHIYKTIQIFHGSAISGWNWKRLNTLGLKLNIQKTKIMASGPITSWEVDGETGSDFIILDSKITADGDCSHEIKRRVLLGRKVMTNLDSILKSRDITLPTKVRLVKAMVFPVVMYGFESWTVKLSTKELMLLNCGVGEDSWEFLELQGDPTSPS